MRRHPSPDSGELAPLATLRPGNAINQGENIVHSVLFILRESLE